jgi:hypothetical protein
MAVVVHRHSAGLDRRKSDSAEDHFVLFGSVLLKRGFAIDILKREIDQMGVLVFRAGKIREDDSGSEFYPRSLKS